MALAAPHPTRPRFTAVQANPNRPTRPRATAARAYPGHISQFAGWSRALEGTTQAQARTGAVCWQSRARGRVNVVRKSVGIVRAMGVEKQVLQAGNGPKPRKGQKVTVHCTGFGKNGDLSQKFWSTKDPGQSEFTFQIGLGKVIKGWDEGVLGMQVGEIARLQCSPDYAYGTGGFPAWGIQPNSPLIFEIEVLSVKD